MESRPLAPLRYHRLGIDSWGMPYQVREHLYIGDIGDAAEVLQKGKDSSDPGGLSHVVSLLTSPSISFFSEWRSSLCIPARPIREVYTDHHKLLCSLEYAGKDLSLLRMAVPLRDSESENLLDFLDLCLDFIHDSRTNHGSVLVHCFAGVSRSAAIITAYLMRSESLSLQDALRSLRERCDFVCPNDGFLDQLQMFEDMGFKVDPASPIYKRLRLKLLGDSFNRGEKIDSSKFGVDPGVHEKAVSPTPTLEPSPVGTLNSTRGYRCKKCTRLVALQVNVMEHVPGEGETSFGWHRQRNDNLFNKADECSSIFIEPLHWMSSVEEGAMEGNLCCAQCDARLGYFNWSGIQCSCGTWITPAFQLNKSRLDATLV